MSSRKKSVPSTIDRLELEVQRLITELRAKGWTIDEIQQQLVELGAPVSRSALGRHIKSMAEATADLTEKRHIAKVLAQTVNPEDTGVMARLNVELAHAAIIRLQMATTSEEGANFDAKEAMFLGSAINSLVGAEGKLGDMIRKAKAEQKKESAETAKTAAQAAGLSKAVVDQIYQAVLGVEA